MADTVPRTRMAVRPCTVLALKRSLVLGIDYSYSTVSGYSTVTGSAESKPGSSYAVALLMLFRIRRTDRDLLHEYEHRTYSCGDSITVPYSYLRTVLYEVL